MAKARYPWFVFVFQFVFLNLFLCFFSSHFLSNFFEGKKTVQIDFRNFSQSIEKCFPLDLLFFNSLNVFPFLAPFFNPVHTYFSKKASPGPFRARRLAPVGGAVQGGGEMLFNAVGTLGVASASS